MASLPGPGRDGGHFLIWAIQGRAAGQGMVFGLAVLNRVWCYKPRDFNPDCEQLGQKSMQSSGER